METEMFTEMKTLRKMLRRRTIFARLGFGWLGLGFRGSGRGPRSGGVLDGRVFRDAATMLGRGGVRGCSGGALDSGAGLRAAGSRARRHGEGAGVDGAAAGAGARVQRWCGGSTRRRRSGSRRDWRRIETKEEKHEIRTYG
jgi:hypothetical protein